MRSRMVLIVGFVAGYVLGARAGRERYMQIMRAARAAWGSDQAQRLRDEAGKAAGQMGHKAAEVVHLVRHRTERDGADEGDLTATTSMIP